MKALGDQLLAVCLVSTITLFAVKPAFAVSCPVLVGATKQMQLDGPVIGTAYSPEAAIGSSENTCTEQAADKTPFHDCWFVDSAGIQHTVWNGRITRKDLTVDRPSDAAQFPFGISTSDDLLNVVGKLSAFPQTSDLWHLGFDGNKIYLGTHFCFTNETGSEVGITIVFDRDSFLLKEIIARENW